LKTVEDCLQYIKDHYAEHQEESAMRVTDFNIFHETMGPFTIKQNSDTIVISHDGTNAYLKWLDGNFILMTDEGTNTNSTLDVRGKGTGVGQIIVLDEDEQEWLFLSCVNGVGIIRANGAAPTEVRIGGDTDYVSFEQDGEINLAGTARVKKYLYIGAGSFRRGASAPDQGTEGTFATLLFADNVTEEAFVNIHIPPDWAVGTDIELAVYWAPTSAGAGHVAWEFDWEAVAEHVDEVLGAGSTHVDIHDDTQSRDNELLETPYGAIAGASIAVDDTIGIKLYRDHDDAGDNYVGDAALIHMEIEYTANKLGEAT